MNPISSQLRTGSIGELLVQIRLLQYGVQAAPPIKDSGNDLIAIRGEVFKALQVKTTTRTIFDLRKLPCRYHLLACVLLVGEGNDLSLDDCKIYLVTKEQVGEKKSMAVSGLRGKELSQGLVDTIFS